MPVSKPLTPEQRTKLREHVATEPPVQEPDPDREVNLARFNESCEFDDWAEGALDFVEGQMRGASEHKERALALCDELATAAEDVIELLAKAQIAQHISEDDGAKLNSLLVNLTSKPYVVARKVLMLAHLTQHSDLELVQELDRRATASAVKVLFFGVWPGTRGHYLHDQHGDRNWSHPQSSRIGGLYPWDTRESQREQTEGVLWYRQTDEYTLLMSWDRSADRRGGCCATFILDKILTPAKAEELAREAFPKVFERIELHLGKSIVLGGRQ